MKYKQSKQRERMLELLRQMETYPTADWLYQKLIQKLPFKYLQTLDRFLGNLREMST